jgi:hypothetical protein
MGADDARDSALIAWDRLVRAEIATAAPVDFAYEVPVAVPVERRAADGDYVRRCARIDADANARIAGSPSSLATSGSPQLMLTTPPPF